MDWIELEWAETGDLGPDRPDYIAIHGEKGVARVYADETRYEGAIWRYFLWWYAVPNHGHTSSRREAFVEVERRYYQHLAGAGDGKAQD